MRTVAAKSQYQTIALASIHESASNPRRIFDESKLAELTDDVAAKSRMVEGGARSEGHIINHLID